MVFFISIFQILFERGTCVCRYYKLSGDFRNGRWRREARKENKSSSGSFLSLNALEDLRLPFVFQDYHLGAV